MFQAAFRRISVATALAPCLLLSWSCGSDSPTRVAPEGPAVVEISPTSVQLEYIGATTQLESSVRTRSGSPATGVIVQWRSLDPGIATVSPGGLVTAAAEGTTRVVATVLALADTATVTVIRVPAALTLASDTTVLTAAGQTKALLATVLDGGDQVIAGAPVSWAIADSGVARMHDDGTVTAVTDGVTTVTARSGPASAMATVWVAIGPASIDVRPDSVTLTSLGDTVQLTATVEDDSGVVITAPLSWTSADPAVAIVSGAGVVRSAGNGTTTVTARAGAVSARAVVTVTQQAAILSVSPRSVVAARDVSVAMATELTDAGGFEVHGAPIMWSSSDTVVAVVNADGIVSTRADGTALVVATSGTLSDTATVVVHDVSVGVVEVLPTSILLDVGQTATLEFRALDPTGRVVIPSPGAWTSTDPGVATVDSLGRVTGTGLGRAWIGLAFGPVRDSSLVTVTPDLVPPAGAFDLDVRFVGVTNPVTTPTPAQVMAVKRAEARWEALLSGDLFFGRPNVAAGACGLPHPAVDEQVDDLLLFVEITDIDGAGRVFSEVTECVVRTSNGLPILATLRLDIRDLHELEASGDLDAAVLREMTHALGFGTSAPWDVILVGRGQGNPYFPGPRAVMEFRAAGFTDADPVPVETTSGFGTRDRRWRETVLGTELMTGFLDSGVANPLSRITLGAMADLGYVVDFAGADPLSAGVPRHASPVKLELQSRWIGPLFEVGEGGGTVRAPHR